MLKSLGAVIYIVADLYHSSFLDVPSGIDTATGYIFSFESLIKGMSCLFAGYQGYAFSCCGFFLMMSFANDVALFFAQN